MSVHVDWLIENQIILIRSFGDLTLENFSDDGLKVVEMLDSSPSESIHVVGDETHLGSVPNDPLSIVRNTPWLKHAKLRWTIAFGKSDRIMKIVTNIGAQLVQMRYRRVDTFPDVVAFLTNIDESLPPAEEITQAFEHIISTKQPY